MPRPAAQPLPGTTAVPLPPVPVDVEVPDPPVPVAAEDVVAPVLVVLVAEPPVLLDDGPGVPPAVEQATAVTQATRQAVRGARVAIRRA